MTETLSRRDHLVETALGLFLKHGFHATGIDAIIKEAGVSKKTLYHHFRTKEALIVAALNRYNASFRQTFTHNIETRATSPRDKILAVFDVAEAWFGDPSFYGCLFINAIGEYASEEAGIRDACKTFKAMIRDYLGELCANLPDGTPDAVADQIALLLEGAIVTAQVSQSPNAARVAKSIAATLI